MSFELTVNWETLCDKHNKYKNDKYTHFLTDITRQTPNRTAFEGGVSVEKEEQHVQAPAN